MRLLFATAVLAAMALPAAAVTVDGNRDSVGDNYGAALAVQTVETQFGDNFSELDAGYGKIEGGMLHLMLTGNLEGNFNKLEIFIDSIAGGQNQIDSLNNPNNDNWSAKMGGLMFDAGFEADRLIILRHGNGGTQFDFDFAEVGLGGFGGLVGTFNPAVNGTGPYATSNGILLGFNNTNAAGVLGGTGAANAAAAAAVPTGIELSIPLSLLGNPAGGIKVSAFVNGSNHDYASNQFLAGLAAGTGNLGGDGSGGFTGTLSGVNLKNFAGDQYFRVPVPEPSSCILAAMALIGLSIAAARRRQG